MITFLYPYFAWLILLPFVVKIILPAVKGSYGDALTVPFAADFADISAQSKAKNISFTNILAAGVGGDATCANGRARSHKQ